MLIDELKRKSDYDFDLPKINGVHQLIVKLSDIEEVLKSCICENCKWIIKDKQSYCESNISPVNKIPEKNWSCKYWESKDVKDE